MPDSPVQAAAEGLPERNAVIANALLNLEAQINELSSMSQIMADLLTDVLTGSEPDEHGYVRMLVSKEDMDNMAFAWCNVSSRAIGLKKAFYAAGKEGEGK